MFIRTAHQIKNGTNTRSGSREAAAKWEAPINRHTRRETLPGRHPEPPYFLARQAERLVLVGPANRSEETRSSIGLRTS
jgi:hypothetical protein